MTRAEMTGRGWAELDVLLVTGDAYVDHPSFGTAMIGRVLEADGWRVGILAQPDWRNPEALAALGRPRLFCGVSAGNLDSMLSNHTAARHRRKDDDFSPGGRPGLRPDHACAVYAQLARRAFPGLPVVLGGIEASLRRVAHYDYWEDKLRPSILADSKADILVYGMGESAIREIARRLGAPAGRETENLKLETGKMAPAPPEPATRNPQPATLLPPTDHRPQTTGLLRGIPGTAVLLGAAESAGWRRDQGTREETPGTQGTPGTAGDDRSQKLAGSLGVPPPSPTDHRPQATDILLPSWEKLKADPKLLLEQTRRVEAEQNPFCGRRLVQFHGARALLIEPPAPPLPVRELDRVYALPFTRRPHPLYNKEMIPAFAMIRDSVTVVRGCPGGCTFCGLGLHQGKFLGSRSQDSILRELRTLAADPEFRGTVTDLGGPSANLYGCGNGATDACRVCRRPSCLFPEICPQFRLVEAAGLALLRAARTLPGLKHVFVQSGIRMDAALRQPAWLREVIRHHVSGHLKVAPEHLHPEVLRRMRKPGPAVFDQFLELFRKETAAAAKEQYLVPYFISSFPGCTEAHMRTVEDFLRRARWNLQQVQDFIPLPMTPAAAMYVTGLDYATGEPISVARGTAARQRQLGSLLGPKR